jgi:hypothetical protein
MEFEGGQLPTTLHRLPEMNIPGHALAGLGPGQNADQVWPRGQSELARVSRTLLNIDNTAGGVERESPAHHRGGRGLVRQPPGGDDPPRGRRPRRAFMSATPLTRPWRTTRRTAASATGAAGRAARSKRAKATSRFIGTSDRRSGLAPVGAEKETRGSRESCTRGQFAVPGKDFSKQLPRK